MKINKRVIKVLALHLGVIVALFILQFIVPPFHVAMLTRVMVFATYTIGYNILLGYTGLMSLGHAMFFATGLYAAGLSVIYYGLSPLEALLIALLLSVIMSAVIGSITLRTSGAFFLIVTMIFSQIFFLTTLYFNVITGGEQGLVLTRYLKPLSLGPLSVELTDSSVKYNFALIIFASALLFSLWLISSPIGRIFVAIRENGERAEMLGYNIYKYKLLAFTTSGTISGMAGATYALVFAYIGSALASILYSVNPLLWTLLGGAGTTIGPIIGTGLMIYIIDFTSSLTSSYLIIVGVTLVLLVLAFPPGIVGAVRRRWLRWLP